MYGVNDFSLVEAKKKFPVTTLKIANKTCMVDDPPHYLGMIEHSMAYHGHVLCAGLGLGLIVHALNCNPDVTRITVVEREQDVIDLVQPCLPQDKLTILHGDFWDLADWYTLAEESKPDGVFYDLFVGDGAALYPQAIPVWIQLSEQYPGTVRRIFGFPNDSLQQLDDLLNAGFLTRRMWKE